MPEVNHRERGCDYDRIDEKRTVVSPSNGTGKSVVVIPTPPVMLPILSSVALQTGVPPPSP
jgi:hypothetical protein